MELEKLAGERIFDFVMTVPDVYDKENERVPEEGLEESLDLWLMHDAPISIAHTNKIIGKGLRWWKDNYKGHKAYFARGLVHKNPLADQAWNKILKREYKDVSIGGFSMNPETNKDGKTDLNGTYVVEVAVCEEGMHPMSDIIGVNELAKSKGIKWIAKAEILEKAPEQIKPGEHSEKWKRCVEQVKQENPDVDAYAVCTASLGEDSFTKDSKELDVYKALKKGSGGLAMKKEEKKPEEETKPDQKPEEQEENKEETAYVTRDELQALLEEFKAALLAELRAPAEVTETTKDGGEPSPDETEDESQPDGDASTPENDEGNGKNEDKDLSKLPKTEELIKREVKKQVEAHLDFTNKARTPRPEMATAGKKEEQDDFKMLKKNIPLDFAEIRKQKREEHEKAMEKIFG